MAAVHIGIGHQDDFVIAQLGDVKVIAVSFRKTAAEGINHGLDFRIGQNLIHGRLLNIEDFSPDGQDGLVLAVPGSLGRAAGGIPLYNEYLTPGGIPALAVCQLTVAVKGKFGLGQHVGLGLFLGPANLG